jgi:signal transduction histidine kinase
MRAEAASLVLVADDEEPTLEILATVVEDLGHQVLTARDGAEAFRLARDHAPDLIITDFMMPGRNGIELIRAVRADAELAAVPVILISAATPAAAVEATRFFAKPLHLGDLEEEIVRILAGNSPATKDRNLPVQATLAQSTRPEALNWLAHELKSPLSAVRMSVELLRRRMEVIGNDQDQSRVQVILRGLDRMTSLMNSVLDAAALGEGKLALRLAPVNLVQFVDRVVALWRDLHPDFEFVLAKPNEDIELLLDEPRIQEVLENLLSNAVKYGGGGAKRIEVDVRMRGGKAAISVRDFGKGVPAAELPHLFERFHRAAESTGQGHGLGLYIASALAKLHGGTLTVSSQLGQGSAFTLSLPRSRD